MGIRRLLFARLKNYWRLIEMKDDPIVNEISNIRDKHAEQFGYDLDAIFKNIKELEKRSGKSFKSFPPKRITPSPKTS